eukprot:CAMPEP_0118945552 /NCGR_PEP_ID=MMETSP1169-20130426/42501_1 /TAXON_ID=36882 /ORGANISM="Pyramimonas obovata, Strain CCMP722" /LENGTH=77 /DNA_ID=CAMNT_0006891297 /DNA_START=194 /DNA_END=424 /DNA_ORIENTATION=-
MRRQHANPQAKKVKLWIPGQESDDEESTPASSVPAQQSEGVDEYLSEVFTTCTDKKRSDPPPAQLRPPQQKSMAELR